MPFMPWTAELELGLPEIDDQQWLVHHICKVDRAYLPFMREALQAQRTVALA
ncbi:MULTISPECIES: hypothetical protein [Diaphorobacter]|uniref:hypothetical protein n=1 Tax=Diaphorobacter TaxID=238749 RepID=UPI001555E2B1|nr:MULTISPECIES: hypothetical protein [Diaphorobacter]QJY32308.1 hypothetical protein HND92_04400 [Diaphorobacter sp. JS3050]